VRRRAPLSAFPTRRSSDLDLRAALHSLKGSAAMAGHADLALVIGQLGTRLRAGDATARDIVLEVLGVALGRLRGGAPPFPTTWRSEEHTSELQSRENLVCR